MVSEKEFQEKVLALASTLEGKLARQFLESLKRLKDSIDIETLTEYISQNRYDLVFARLSMNLVDKGFGAFSMALTNAYAKSGELIAELISPVVNPITGGETQVIFDVVHPRVAQVANYYKMGKIQQIEEDIREVIRQTVYDAVQQGMNPRDTAKLIRGNIGLTKHQMKAVDNFRLMLETKPQRALHSELRDKRFDPLLARMIESKERIPAQKIDQMVEAYRQKYITHRAVAIARTESIRIMNMASRQIWVDMVAEGKIPEEYIIRKWKTAGDKNVRHAHREIPKMNPDGVGLNEPFNSPLGAIMYPGDPSAPAANVVNCRCTIFHRVSLIGK
jgi:hypothetical protein